ncbi:hypothetical protein Hanom_Chr02g00168761 [Helianthus anomalus]
MEVRALGWYNLTREFLKVPYKAGKSSKKKCPRLCIKVVMRRLKNSFRSSSHPVLHAAARVVQEMRKSRAAAFALGLLNIEGDVVNAYSKSNDWDHGTSESEGLCQTRVVNEPSQTRVGSGSARLKIVFLMSSKCRLELGLFSWL